MKKTTNATKAFAKNEMKKVIVSMNITLDGYMSGPDAELDWHFERWDPDIGQILTKELSKADTILLGRVTYEAMAMYWPTRAMDFLCPRDDIAYAVMMNRHHKAVYSKSLEKTTWNNSTLIKGNIKKEITLLKKPHNGHDKDIITYGSGKLVAALIKLNLVDEFQLWIHPVILGKGKPLFRELNNKYKLRLLNTKTFHSGVVFVHYEVMK
jgi:dihydrofolate reductase